LTKKEYFAVGDFGFALALAVPIAVSVSNQLFFCTTPSPFSDGGGAFPTFSGFAKIMK